MIFEDPSKVRGKIVFYSLHAVAFIVMAFFLNIIIGFVVEPPPPNAEGYEKEFSVVAHEHGHEHGPKYHNDIIRNRKNIEIALPEALSTTLLASAESAPQKIPSTKKLPPISDSEFLHSAFITQNDPLSVKSLQTHIDQIDIVFPDAFTVTGTTCNVSESINWEVQNMLVEKKKMILPRLSNVDSAWRGKEFATLIKNPTESSCLIETLRKKVLYYNGAGINIDIEELEPSVRNDFTRWFLELASVFHAEGLYVTIDLPMQSPVFDYETIGQVADAVIFMAYDEHFAGGKPGPIAGDLWFQKSLEEISRKVPKEKIVVAIGNYSYDWDTTAGGIAKNRSFDETMTLARSAGVKIKTDDGSINSTFRYQDSLGHWHEVWMLDSVSAWNQYLAVRENGVRGISFWRLGLEDPGIWKFLGNPESDKFQPRELQAIENLEKFILSGTGEILKVVKLPEDGKRSLVLEGQKIVSAQYTALPQNFIVDAFGELKEKTVALTFDDGPSKEYTENILDTLKKHNVPATFFPVGERIEKYPEIILRQLEEGHLIGNHTFSHLDIHKMSTEQFKFELNDTQRLIASITGRQTLIFRAPYNSEMDPRVTKSTEHLQELGKMGYISVGAGINSFDYDRPGTEKIVENVMKEVQPNTSNIVLLHDSGGDRSQTIAALDILIPKLREDGYTFVTVNELFGVSKEAFMPKAPIRERLIAWGRGMLATIRTQGWELVSAFFLVATFISILRILFLGVFVLRTGKDEKPDSIRRFHPPVTILVPAYNEEKVIERTITGLLQSYYPKFEILVVDDGSTDGTAERVKRMTEEHENVRLITKKNEGKSKALNLGFREATYEYIVTVDADTIVYPRTVYHLMQPFAHADVDAVCGNIGIGNVKNILTAFQEVEYVTGQNYDRRAFDALNCISVVPGATGAWKKQMVLDIGGYSEDTLTEDADLTLTILEHGGKIVYAPLARSVTEAPETVGSLFKQRFRWSYGTFQCFWKHRKTFGKGAIGNIALPNIFFFQMILPLLSPIGDIVFLIALFSGNLNAIIVSYFVFIFIDSAASGIAYALDRKSIKNAWVVFIQRFFYRQFMYIVTFSAILAAFAGDRHGWNKLERKASVRITETV